MPRPDHYISDPGYPMAAALASTTLLIPLLQSPTHSHLTDIITTHGANHVAAMACWSSLAHDAVAVIGDHLLAARDLDYYMNMRAVCRDWRVATLNPSAAEAADPRFHLQQWVMLDEKKYPKRGDTLVRLFLNTATGRFVHKELTALVNYYFITSMGGLLVVASRSAPHAVSIYNPFTNSFMEFMAPIPKSVQHTTAYLYQVGQLPPTLVLEIGVSQRRALRRGGAQPVGQGTQHLGHGW
ncbi:hypothetical protein ACQ4PT_018357 [Festuca glaucescens]